MDSDTPQPSAVKGLNGVIKVIKQDLEAIPEEAIFRSFGGKSRSVADIIAELNLVNDHVGMVIRGEEPFTWPEGDWIKAPAEWTTKAQVVEAFNASSGKIQETIQPYTDEYLESPLKTDEGETTRAERLRFMTLHLWYHSGQFNYIQTLLGDDGWHWS